MAGGLNQFGQVSYTPSGYSNDNNSNGSGISGLSDLISASRGGLNVKQTVQEKTSGMTAKQAVEFKKLLQQQINQSKLQLKRQEEAIKNDKTLSEEERKSRSAEVEAQLKELKGIQSQSGSAITSAIDAVVQALTTVGAAYSQSIETVANDIKTYQAQVNTRLQGLTDTINMYGEYSSDITQTFGANALISEQTLLKNLNDAVSKGIAVDIEQRAFLQTIKEDIAQTFDAFDSNLTRLIRLQEENTTSQRLGMESALNTTLNSLFQDSSYLSDITTSAISGLLLEAESGMSGNEAVQFEFAVQKWLGGLYSKGMSSSAITSLATAIGQLGSGNITGMSTEMQNLLSMGASMSNGSSFSQLLSEGLDASSVNTLMQGIVEYLDSISDTTGQVAKLAHSSVFGMTLSDIQAASNIYGSIGAISGTSADMLGQLATAVGNISEVIGLSGQYANVKDNLMYSTASYLMAGNGLGYMIYSIINDIGSLIDVAIPTISAAGFSLSFEGTKVSDILQAAVGGLGIIGSGVALVQSMVNGGNGRNIGTEWYMPSGTDLSSLSTTGLSIGTSKTYTQGSGTDISSGAIGDATDSAQESSGQEVQSAPDTTTDDVCDSLTELYDSLFVSRRPILVDINSFPEEMSPIKVVFPDDEAPIVRVAPGDDAIPVTISDDSSSILQSWRG